MKRNVILIGLIMLSLIFTNACGGSSMTVKTEDNKTQTFDVKDGWFITEKDSRMSGDVTEHLICVANYEMKVPPGSSALNLEAPVKEGEAKVCFTMNGPQGFDENATIKAGKYKMASFSGGYTPDAVGLSPSIRIFVEGKEKKESLRSNATDGEVEITSASADQISGTINLHDDKNREIKGNFTAKKVKKG